MGGEWVGRWVFKTRHYDGRRDGLLMDSAEQTATSSSTVGSTAGGGRGRYLLGCVLVVAMGVGLSKLLATAGLLPFIFGIVGVFFFMLVGLLLAAIMYRFGRDIAPLPRSLVIGSIVVLTLAITGGTVFFEYLSLVDNAAEEVLRVNDLNPRERQQREMVVRMRQQIEDYWRSEHGFGGPIGDVAWAAGGSAFQIGPADGGERQVVHPQSGFTWLLRGLISFAALGWAVWAQVYPLHKAQQQRDEPKAEEPKPPE